MIWGGTLFRPQVVGHRTQPFAKIPATGGNGVYYLLVMVYFLGYRHILSTLTGLFHQKSVSLPPNFRKYH